MGRDESGGQRRPEFDVQLGCRLPRSLSVQCPPGRMRAFATRTTLVGRVRQPDQLAGLLAELCSAGLVIDDVVRLTGPAGDDDTTYEIRVEGDVGASALPRLSWRHHVVAEQTVVRIAAGSADLLQWLKACTDAGVIIQSVRRIVPPPLSGPA